MGRDGRFASFWLQARLLGYPSSLQLWQDSRDEQIGNPKARSLVQIDVCASREL
jgi:hypothetical protein